MAVLTRFRTKVANSPDPESIPIPTKWAKPPRTPKIVKATERVKDPEPVKETEPVNVKPKAKPGRPAKYTAEERIIQARKRAQDRYLLNRDEMNAKSALRYLAKNPNAKTRPKTADNIVKRGLAKVDADSDLPIPDITSRIAKPHYIIKQIPRTAVDTKTNTYPTQSFLGVQWWIVNRTNRVKLITEETIKHQLSDWTVIMKGMANKDNVDDIDDVMPYLNKPVDIYNYCINRNASIGGALKQFTTIWMIARYNEEISKMLKNDVGSQYNILKRQLEGVSQDQTRDRQTDPFYAVPSFNDIIKVVEGSKFVNGLGKGSQFDIFLRVYRETVGRDDYGSLKIAENMKEVNFNVWPNWFIKNADNDHPDRWNPMIYVSQHKTGGSSGGIKKTFTTETGALIKEFLASRPARKFLFIDEETGEPFPPPAKPKKKSGETADDAEEAGKLAKWVAEMFVKANLRGLTLGDLRQSMATELKSKEVTADDKAKNSALMGHTVDTHELKYGRLIDNGLLDRLQNHHKYDQEKAKTKIEERGRLYYKKGVDAGEVAARHTLRAFIKDKNDETVKLKKVVKKLPQTDITDDDAADILSAIRDVKMVQAIRKQQKK